MAKKTTAADKTTKRKKTANDALIASTLLSLQSDVESVAYWTRPSSLTLLERESAAWLGATRAVMTYDASKGASLRTWTQLKARYAIEDDERRERRQRKRFGKSLGIIWGAPARSQNDDEHTIAQRERARQIVQFALSALDERTREIIERVWFCGESQAEIARSFGFSQSWCSRLYRRGMATIKEQASLAIERGI